MPIIKINNFHRGQASSPYIDDGAYAKAANIDIFGLPGIARINYKPVKESGTTIGDNIPSNFARDPESATDVYATDNASNVYYSNDAGGSWSLLASGKGTKCAVWKDYLFVAGTTTLNTYGPLSGTPSWTSFQTNLENTSEHKMHVSRNDGLLYICNDRYVASLEEKSGQNFAPGTSATYTWTPQHLTLPEGFHSLCLEEQRENLLIGSYYGNSASQIQRATIFIWDREKNLYDYPLSIPIGLITSMINVANRVYVAGGSRGKIYLFSENGMTPLFQLPFDYDDGDDINIGLYGRQGLAVWKDQLLIALDSDDGLAPAGIYAYKNGALTCAFLPSTGADGSNNQLRIGGIYAFDRNTLLYGCFDGGQAVGSRGFIDRIKDTFNRYDGYAAYLESLYYRVGTKHKPANFSNVEVQLARPLQTGEAVRLKYRTGINDSWTTIGTFDFASYGAVSSNVFKLGLHGIENLQARIELETGSSSKNTPYLYEVVIR